MYEPPASPPEAWPSSHLLALPALPCRSPSRQQPQPPRDVVSVCGLPDQDCQCPPAWGPGPRCRRRQQGAGQGPGAEQGLRGPEGQLHGRLQQSRWAPRPRPSAEATSRSRERASARDRRTGRRGGGVSLGMRLSLLEPLPIWASSAFLQDGALKELEFPLLARGVGCRQLFGGGGGGGCRTGEGRQRGQSRREGAWGLELRLPPPTPHPQATTCCWWACMAPERPARRSW